MENNKLQHWGIKGMKWGHRRYQNRDGSLTPEGRARYDDDGDGSARANTPKAHDDYTKAHTRRDVSTMSTKELNDTLNRMDAERRYKEATMTKGEKFKRWAAKTATDVGAEVAKDYTKKALKTGVEIGLEKWMGSTKDPKTANFLSKMLKLNKDDAEGMIENAKNRLAKNKTADTENTKKPYEAPTADISPKMTKGVKKAFKDVRGSGESDSTPAAESPGKNGKNEKGARDTRDKRETNNDAEPKKTNSAPALAAPAKKTYESPSVEKVPAREIGSGNLNDSQKSMIKALRASGGMTVSEVANAVGVSPSTVSRYTAGSAKPKKKEEKD